MDIVVESMAILPLFVSDVTKVENDILEHEGADCALDLGSSKRFLNCSRDSHFGPLRVRFLFGDLGLLGIPPNGQGVGTHPTRGITRALPFRAIHTGGLGILVGYHGPTKATLLGFTRKSKLIKMIVSACLAVFCYRLRLKSINGV